MAKVPEPIRVPAAFAQTPTPRFNVPSPTALQAFFEAEQTKQVESLVEVITNELRVVGRGRWYAMPWIVCPQWHHLNPTDGAITKTLGLFRAAGWEVTPGKTSGTYLFNG